MLFVLKGRNNVRRACRIGMFENVNKMNYYFEDFTIENYKRLIRIAKSNNIITTYECAMAGKGIVYRHDIDFSPHRALKLSQIEKAENVQAYYFVHLHSQYYSVFEKNIVHILNQIARNGGKIELHFEPAFYDLNRVEDFEEKIEFEVRLLESILDIPQISVMSFHNPDVGKWHEIGNDYLGGLLNVYGKMVKSSLEYCSDSNGYWRFKRLEDVLQCSSGKSIQILTHPVWWQDNIMSPYERIVRSVNGRNAYCISLYENQMKDLGRINVK